MGYSQKILRFAKNQFYLIKQRDFIQFFHEISLFSPRWLFKVNSGSILKTDSPRIVFRKYQDYIFEMATDRDIAEIAKSSGVPESELKKRLALGDECSIARYITNANKIVNIIWTHRGSCYIKGLGLDLKMGNNEAYLYGGFTTPEARMKGIFNTAFKFVYDTLNERGIESIVGVVEGWNRKAYNYHLKLNFKPIAEITFLIIFFVKISIFTDLETQRKKIRIFLSFPKDRILI